MIVRLSLVVAALFAGVVALAHAQLPQTANVGVGDDFYDPTAATIALDGTVTFAYDEGFEEHNVRFETSGAVCTQLTGDSTGPVSGRALPSTPEGPGWTGQCQFPASGSYSFFCDFHPYMRGTITVANADGTVPTPTPTATATPTPGRTPTPTATASPSPGGGGSPGPTPAPGGGTTPTTAAKATIRASQRGTAVAATVTGGSARARVVIEALARRADLRASGRARLVRVGRVSRTVAAGATVRVSVPLNARGRAALRRLGRLRLTVRLTLAGKASTRAVTLRRPAR